MVIWGLRVTHGPADSWRLSGKDALDRTFFIDIRPPLIHPATVERARSLAILDVANAIISLEAGLGTQQGD